MGAENSECLAMFFRVKHDDWRVSGGYLIYVDRLDQLRCCQRHEFSRVSKCHAVNWPIRLSLRLLKTDAPNMSRHDFFLLAHASELTNRHYFFLIYLTSFQLWLLDLTSS